MNEFESDWISLSQSQSGVRVFLSESERRNQGVWIQHGRIQDDCHHQVESEWMSEGFFVQMVWTNFGKCEWVWEGKLRWLPSKMPKFKIAEFKMAVIIKLSAEWMSLSQIELVWVRVWVEWECFWVNLREDKKVSESKMAVSESNMVEFKMAAIIKLSQNEWVKVFFVQMVGTNFGKCEWVWEGKLRWLNPR